MKNLILTTLALLASLAAAPSLLAQTYNIPWHKIGPGGMSAGGAYAIRGSAGQLDAGNLSGGDFILSGGFWVSPRGGGTLQPPMYDLVALDTLGQGSSAAFALNNSGQIVGHVNFQAALWTTSHSPAMTLGNLDGDGNGEAFGINDTGQIVGYTRGSLGPHAAFWANSSSSPAGFATLSSGSNSTAFAINASGQAVGYSFIITNSDLGFSVNLPSLWAGGSGRFLESTHGQAHGINDSGRIVGWNAVPDGHQQAVFWDADNGSASALPGFGLDSRGFVFHSEARGINASGQMVGFSETNDFGFRAVFWANRNSAPVVLRSLSGPDAGGQTRSIDGLAWSINASGQIVGYSVPVSGPDNHAVLWLNSTSPPIDLNTVVPRDSGWVLQTAYAINDSGEIVGSGTLGGEQRAFALVPVPRAPRVSAVARSGNSLQINFSSQAGHTYNVLSTSDLVSGLWSSLQTGITGNGSTVQVTIPNAFVQPRQFFRIQTQ